MNLAEFEEKWKIEGKTEVGTIKCFLIAILEYLDGNEEAEKMIVLPMQENEINRVKYYLTTQFGRTKNIAASYLGGTPDNDYQYNYDNEVVILESQSKRGEDKSKIFIKSGGKDLPSPVHLQKDDQGYWKLINVSSIATGVQKSKSEKEEN
ncbi:MAG: DUF6935 domain-containing protein [Promethearchaeota archaeon]